MNGTEPFVVYLAQPLMDFFYILGGSIAVFTGFEVFNKYMERRDKADTMRRLVDLHEMSTLKKTMREDNDGDERYYEMKALMHKRHDKEMEEEDKPEEQPKK